MPPELVLPASRQSALNIRATMTRKSPTFKFLRESRRVSLVMVAVSIIGCDAFEAAGMPVRSDWVCSIVLHRSISVTGFGFCHNCQDFFFFLESGT